MNNTIFHLSTCSTNQRILSELKDYFSLFELVNIKEQPLTKKQLETLKKMTGNYESLFSKRAQLYQTLALKNEEHNEAFYKKYLLEHYTFLRRPVIVFKNKVYLASLKKELETLLDALKKETKSS